MSIAGVDPVSLLGENNRKLNLIREAYPEAKVTARGSNVKIRAEKQEAQRIKHHLELMMRLLQDNRELTDHTVEDVLAGENPFATQLGTGDGNKTIVFGRNGRPIKARTTNQAKLVSDCESIGMNQG